MLGLLGLRLVVTVAVEVEEQAEQRRAAVRVLAARQLLEHDLRARRCLDAVPRLSDVLEDREAQLGETLGLRRQQERKGSLCGERG